MILDQSIEILDFDIPHFVRIGWASPKAQEVWEQRLYQIAAAWEEIEWRSVVLGLRQACILDIPSNEVISKSDIWAQHGLQSVKLEIRTEVPRSCPSFGLSPGGQRKDLLRVVIASPENIGGFLHAFENRDHLAKGVLLGYPRCCTRFFQYTRTDLGLSDTTVALASALGQRNGESASDVRGPCEINVLLRSIGIKAIPHFPCSMMCEASVQLAHRLLRVGSELGFAEEMNWLAKVLDWPVYWSCLHGIAEIKTPILRIATATDATAKKLMIRFHGHTYPEEGSLGINFPYRPHSNKSNLTHKVESD